MAAGGRKKPRRVTRPRDTESQRRPERCSRRAKILSIHNTETTSPITPITNADIAEILREMAIRLEGEGVAFKPQAYERAAMVVASFDRPLSAVYAVGGVKALDAIHAIGHGIAARIGELLETGKMADLEELRRKLPADVMGLASLDGVGAKTIAALHTSLGVRTIDDLEQAIKAGKIRELSHFGEKSKKKLHKALELYKSSHARKPIAEAQELVRPIEERIRRAASVEQAEVAGSLRRRKETIGDIDIVAASTRPEEVVELFVSMPEVRYVYGQGPTKALVRLKGDIDADLRVVDPKSFGAALQYFTGNKDHNVALRTLARKKGLKLSEYGLFEGDRLVAGRTEDEVYRALGLQFVPPEIRENSGEIEKALAHKLPRLIADGDVKGDLQIHTKWTDGVDTIAQMAEAAKKLGRAYIAVTDHARDLPMARGLDEDRLRQQIAEVRLVNSQMKGIAVLAGVEANIRPDGSLDIADEILQELDFVGAAIHSHFEQPRNVMTARLVRAMANPYVDAIFHPLGRAFGKRASIDVDFDSVVQAAHRTGTLLEIDAQPERLDLCAELCRIAIEAGVRILVDSDAHNVEQLSYPETYGIGVARRAWARAADVANTLALDAFLRTLKPRHRPSSHAALRPAN